MNLSEEESLIKKVGSEVEQDREEIMNLIQDIESEISNMEKKNKKTYLKIVGNVAATIGCGIGVVATGGILGVILGASALINTTAMGINSAKVVKNKKTIKEYKEILSRASEEYHRIEKELESLKERYEQLINEYIPVNLE